MEVNINGGTSFVEEVAWQSGQPVKACFQCQKCSSGCPIAGYSDYSPSQVVRLVQYGNKDLLFNSLTVWLCTGCEACGARCPNGISISKINDFIKEMAGHEYGNLIPEWHFHRGFLESVYAHGRAHEAGFMATYKLKSRQLFTDIGLGFNLFRKGKLNLRPSRVKNKQQVRQIFDRSISP